ncbi:hypothetical protein PXC01_05780 [Maribacter sp. M208]|uniref:hypothetical protein n=1 Tax=Maribacter huludaoensis TaxID=3030010 RepID=UPI0023EDD0AB|nr:hypothetical protein [Maribacter huludaoensis]MDF4221089.1 hypothetical protein [Maribacter huludaoensis]
MKKLSVENRILMRIQTLLNTYLSAPNTAVEINSIELYDVIKKNPELRKRFSSNTAFNRFLRNSHKYGDMKSLINYRVDDSNNLNFRWFFRFKNLREKAKSTNTTVNKGTYNYYKYSQTAIASDGVRFSSSHEVSIYEYLLKESHLRIDLEYPLIINGEQKFVDFTITNKLNRKVFYWEHLGMINSEEYKEKMVNKIEWYLSNGIKSVEDGGNLIYTYYHRDSDFIKDIKKCIQIIKN